MYNIFIVLNTLFLLLYSAFLIVLLLKKRTKRNIYIINFITYIISILMLTLFISIYNKYIISNIQLFTVKGICECMIFILLVLSVIKLLLNFISFARRDTYSINKIQNNKEIDIMVNDFFNQEYANDHTSVEDTVVIEIL